MRTVLFVRHAQSGWDGASGDYERTLDEKGKQEALEMAKRLADNDIPLDALFSSPARRAQKTAGFFVRAYELPPNALQTKAELYQPTDEIFFNVIQAVNDECHHPAIFSHNPGITHFVNLLCDNIAINYMPTCAVFAIKTDILHWRDFPSAPKQFWFFESPRTISGSYPFFI
ncbi:MAG: histidine phosphatase family protein [Chitinophagaceae bacterium]|nr:histidine phosphatase family protein [Chitinophagaceae bacterium]